MRGVPGGLYLPGTSMVHRAPAWAKLAALAVLVPVMVWRRDLPTTSAVGAALLLAALVARAPGRVLAGQLRPVVWFVVPVTLFQGWREGPLAGAVTAAVMLLAVAAAALVTLTTRTEDLLDAIVAVLRPLRRLGVDPDRAGLVLAMTVASLPVVARIVGEVQQARTARGAGRSVRALAVPVVIRTVRHADRLGEALTARGVDD